MLFLTSCLSITYNPDCFVLSKVLSYEIFVHKKFCMLTFLMDIFNGYFSLRRNHLNVFYIKTLLESSPNCQMIIDFVFTQNLQKVSRNAYLSRAIRLDLIASQSLKTNESISSVICLFNHQFLLVKEAIESMYQDKIYYITQQPFISLIL